jgi:hypothetical protein
VTAIEFANIPALDGPEREGGARRTGPGTFPAMLRAITGFHQDPEGEWVAELECGHGQHVRHDPPWQVREWILSEPTRRQHLRTLLQCRLCDAPDAATEQ